MTKIFRHEYDFIRIISALAVLTIHVTSIHITTNTSAYFLNHLVRFCVPMFILLAGLVSPNLDSEFKPIPYYKKKIKTILIPYILALSFYLLFEILFYSGCFDAIFFIKRLIFLFLHGYSHLYFLTIILQLFLLYPLLRFLYLRHSKVLIVASFLVSLYIQTAIFLIESKGIFIIPFTSTIPYYVTFLPYIFYFVIGIYFNQTNISSKISSYSFSLFWILSFGILLIDSSFSKTIASALKPTIILYTIATFFLLVLVYKKANLIKYKKQLRFFSSLTFGFYIFHMILLTLGKIYIFKGIFWTSFLGIISQIVILTILTSLIVFLYKTLKKFFLSIIFV
jgi:surface polysaccharide O-acyltransferase-like enzyme